MRDQHGRIYFLVSLKNFPPGWDKKMINDAHGVFANLFARQSGPGQLKTRIRPKFPTEFDDEGNITRVSEELILRVSGGDAVVARENFVATLAEGLGQDANSIEQKLLITEFEDRQACDNYTAENPEWNGEVQ
jgi:hypothetical protein